MQTGIRPAVRTEQPLLDQRRFGVGAIHRFRRGGEAPGNDDMAVAFGLQRHLGHGACLSRFGFHGGQNVVEPVVICGQGLPEHRKPLVDLGNRCRRRAGTAAWCLRHDG
jgi:hypothetical protein